MSKRKADKARTPSVLTAELERFAANRRRVQCLVCKIPLKPLRDAVDYARGKQSVPTVIAFLATKGVKLGESTVRKHWSRHLDA